VKFKQHTIKKKQPYAQYESLIPFFFFLKTKKLGALGQSNAFSFFENQSFSVLPSRVAIFPVRVKR
jgi:hypothetical protein